MNPLRTVSTVTRRLRKILQSSSHAPVAEQGCAGVARHPDQRSYSAPANLGRIAPPICPDLVSDRDIAISLDHDPILSSTANPADEVFGRHSYLAAMMAAVPGSRSPTKTSCTL